MGCVKNTSSSEKEFVAAGVRVVLQGGEGTEVPALSPFECGVLERTDHFELSNRFDLIQWMGEIATKIGEKGFGDSPKDSIDFKEEVVITKTPEEVIPPEEVTPPAEEVIPPVNDATFVDELTPPTEEETPPIVVDDDDLIENPVPEWVACLDAKDPVEALKEFSGAELKGFCDELKIADYGSKTEMANRLIEVWTTCDEETDEDE